MLSSRSSTHGAGALRARSGFSLIELVLVMLIGGVVTSMSLGKIHALLTHQRVVYAANAVRNHLEAAFQIAGRTRKPVQNSWNSSTQQFVVGDRSGTMYYRKTNLS